MPIRPSPSPPRALDRGGRSGVEIRWRRVRSRVSWRVCGVGGSGWFLKHERVCKGVQGASGYRIRIYAGPVSVNLTVQV